MGTNNGIGSQGLILDGPPEQKARYLPRLASGELDRIVCIDRARCRVGRGIVAHARRARRR
ncbi:acyl-CoA dehydrogenase family protein (plasmid) [Mycetohabitans rhizoxinica]